MPAWFAQFKYPNEPNLSRTGEYGFWVIEADTEEHAEITARRHLAPRGLELEMVPADSSDAVPVYSWKNEPSPDAWKLLMAIKAMPQATRSETAQENQVYQLCGLPLGVMQLAMDELAERGFIYLKQVDGVEDRLVSLAYMGEAARVIYDS